MKEAKKKIIIKNNLNKVRIKFKSVKKKIKILKIQIKFKTVVCVGGPSS